MNPSHRQVTDKGSWRWAAHVAELIAWGTAALLLIVLSLASLPPGTFHEGLALLGLIVVWIAVFFRFVLPAQRGSRWGLILSLAVAFALAAATYSILRGQVRSAQLVFVPVIVMTGLLANLRASLFAAALASGAYLGIAENGGSPQTVVLFLNAGIFLLSGAVAGLLSRELRLHYRGEQEEHRLATAVRHRLLAVLDAVDEAILFRTREGVVRVVNQRAAELFDVEPDDYLGGPAVELLRTIARLTEDPEGFMELFQDLRDEPEKHLRESVDQILPARRQLRMYSGPTFDEAGALVGRIDVFADITEATRRAAEVERLYQEARQTAESFQRALLPESVPSLPRVSLVAHYVPAAGRRAVCGDFYDFIPVSDGRVVLVLGDVVGAGPAAANDAALARYSLRSFAAQESEPARLLERMNAHVHQQGRPERFVRLFVAVLDPERAVVEFANAGHVPPVCYRSDGGDVEWIEEGGLPLGVESDATYKAGHIDMHPGDMLVLYTDGVTEASRSGRPFGQGHFSDIVRDYGVGTPGELVQAIRRAVDKWTADTELRDDLALLVCQIVPDALVGEAVRELVLPNEPARMSEIRRFVAHFLADVRAPVEVSSEVLMALGEAAANAAKYGRPEEGRSEVRIRCALESGTFTVTVADDGPGFDPPPPEEVDLPERYSSGGRGLFLMRALMDDVVITSSDDGTTVTMAKHLGLAA